MVVVAQGAGMKLLEDAKAKRRLDSLRLLPLQPIARFPEVLAAGDVLVAVIEADAGTYSVPSKVQSYLCAAGLFCGCPKREPGSTRRGTRKCRHRRCPGWERFHGGRNPSAA